MTTTAATPSRTTTKTSVLPLLAFFALAYALSWLILVPAGFGLLPDSGSILLAPLLHAAINMDMGSGLWSWA